MDLVVDTNIFVSGIIQDEFSLRAKRLFDQIALPSPPDLFAPQILVAETAHVLLKLHRIGRISKGIAEDAYSIALLTPFVARYDRPLTAKDFELGLRHTIGGSDLFFVRLARDLDCPLVTMDRALRTNAAPLVETLDLDGALARLGL